MRLFVRYVIFTALLINSFGSHSKTNEKPGKKNIIIENSEMRLVIGANGKALNLVHKTTGKECLMPGSNMPAFAITQYTPYEDELQLARPAKSTTFAADSVIRVGDDLIVNFALVNIEVIIRLKITDAYIGFTLTKINHHLPAFGDHLKTPVDEFTILQLPVRDRIHFGEWLNVVWDKDIAVNVLASDPYAKIDAVKFNGYHLLQAGAVSEIKSFGVGAVLITTAKEKLLDRIDRMEQDFKLPRGVQSRRSKDYKYSYLQTPDITPKNVDEYIVFAKQAGFRAIQLTWTAFSTTIGHFPWRPEYPNGLADLQMITRKIRDAGLLVGTNMWYSKAHKQDLYVSPVPDHRLNLRSIFTLTAALDRTSTTITVEENPKNCTMDDGRRILRIGNELIEYKKFTSEPPYQFTGCTRGILKTNSSEYQSGHKIGLLDIDTWPTNWVRFDQKTSIQQEVAARIAEIYNGAGFQFVYFNGADDVNPPYWFNVSSAQLKVFNLLKPVPVFSEGATRSHFSWHMLTRGNAFGGFSPEVIKEATRKHPAPEAEYIASDFTSINFGFIRYVSPGAATMGIQPDMIEFVCSRGAAWDSPVSLTGNLGQLKSHPRTKDNLEVIRRWEEARIGNFFTEKQKTSLKDVSQEHTLLVNESGKFELYPYNQILDVAGGNGAVRAFTFKRAGKTCVVYWHTSGQGSIEIALSAGKVQLFKNPGEDLPVQRSGDKIVIPTGDRHYLEVNLPLEKVILAFKNATVI